MKCLLYKGKILSKDEYEPNPEIIKDINDATGLIIAHPRTKEYIYEWEDNGS